MWSAKELKKVFKRIDYLKPEMVKTQVRLTAIPALSPVNKGDGEIKKTGYVKKLLKSMGFDRITEVRVPDKNVPCGYRPSLIVKFKGLSSQKTIWIMSHLDIVPPGPRHLWKSDPYKAVVKGGKIYGRGTEDNQQPVVSSIYAVKSMRDAKLMPGYDIGLILIADEETGSKYGIQYILQHHSLFRKNDIIVVPDAGNAIGNIIEIAEKSMLWLKITTQGKQCHASTPYKGINAHRAGAYLLCHLDKALHKKYNKSDAIFNPAHSTFEPTKKEANVENINTIPGEDVFYFDCRIIPGYNIEEIEKWIKKEAREIEKKFKVKVSTETVYSNPSTKPTRADAPVVRALQRGIHYVTGQKATPIGVGAGTVAAYLRKKGYQVAVWSIVNNTCHQPNEFCVIDNMLKEAKVFAYLFGCTNK